MRGIAALLCLFFVGATSPAYAGLFRAMAHAAVHAEEAAAVRAAEHAAVEAAERGAKGPLAQVSVKAVSGEATVAKMESTAVGPMAQGSVTGVKAEANGVKVDNSLGLGGGVGGGGGTVAEAAAASETPTPILFTVLGMIVLGAGGFVAFLVLRDYFRRFMAVCRWIGGVLRRHA